MLNSINVRSLTEGDSHPDLPKLKSKEEKAQQLHRLLLDMAKDETEKPLKSKYRQTADFVRETFFGRTTAQVRARVISVLEDYCDGETAFPVEIDNLIELTGIKEKDLQPVLDKMVRKGEILQGRRRRHQEAGKHYNALYKLNR